MSDARSLVSTQATSHQALAEWMANAIMLAIPGDDRAAALSDAIAIAEEVQNILLDRRQRHPSQQGKGGK